MSTDSVLKKPLRIAYCLPKLTGGADLLQQMQIASGLQDRGHFLTFVAPMDLSETICTADLKIQSIAQRTWTRKSWFTATSKIAWQLQKCVGLPYLNVFSNYRLYDASLQCLPGHDIVQERNGLYKMGVAMACKRLQLPYILFFDADDIFEQDFLGQPIKGILRQRAKQIIQYTLRAANAVITVSDATKARLKNIWRIPSEKIVVFPNGVDVHRFQPYPEKRFETRFSLGLSDQPVIIYVGGFYPWHDVETLVVAFAQVLKEYPLAQLLLVGDGKQRSAIVQKVRYLGIEHAVIFTGLRSQKEIPYLISAADVAVAPFPEMRHDFWLSPMKLFEYMASSTALIASNVGLPVTQVIQNERNGLLTSPGDSSDLSKALLRLMDNSDLREKLGQQARKDAILKYSWDQYLTRLERLYETVLLHQSIELI